METVTATPTAAGMILNLGFETMANEISHPDPETRRRVNHYAVDMSYLTIPVVTDGEALTDEETTDKLREVTTRQRSQRN